MLSHAHSIAQRRVCAEIPVGTTSMEITFWLERVSTWTIPKGNLLAHRYFIGNTEWREPLEGISGEFSYRQQGGCCEPEPVRCEVQRRTVTRFSARGASLHRRDSLSARSDRARTQHHLRSAAVAVRHHRPHAGPDRPDREPADRCSPARRWRAHHQTRLLNASRLHHLGALSLRRALFTYPPTTWRMCLYLCWCSCWSSSFSSAPLFQLDKLPARLCNDF